MDKEKILEMLRFHETDLHSIGVSHLYLFGSLITDTASPESDVDMFFDFNKKNFSIIDLLKLKEKLQIILHKKADIMTRASIHPAFRQAIEKEALKVF